VAELIRQIEATAAAERAKKGVEPKIRELSFLQRPSDLVSTEDDAGRKCIRADELE